MVLDVLSSDLLSKGVNPAKVAERLGHDLPTLLAAYAHVMPKDDDRVRAIVDEALGGSAEDWLRTGWDWLGLAED